MLFFHLLTVRLLFYRYRGQKNFFIVIKKSYTPNLYDRPPRQKFANPIATNLYGSVCACRSINNHVCVCV